MPLLVCALLLRDSIRLRSALCHVANVAAFTEQRQLLGTRLISLAPTDAINQFGISEAFRVFIDVTKQGLSVSR
jgi:hypothetical protein